MLLSESMINPHLLNQLLPWKAFSGWCSGPWDRPPPRPLPFTSCGFSSSARLLILPSSFFFSFLLALFSDIFYSMEIRWQSELQMELNWVIHYARLLCFPYLKSGNNFSVDNLSLMQPFLVLPFFCLSYQPRPSLQNRASFISLPNFVWRPAGFFAYDSIPAASLLSRNFCIKHMRWYHRQVNLSSVYVFCSHNTVVMGMGCSTLAHSMCSSHSCLIA